MATVKTLVDFYKSQNALAVQAAGTTASLKAAGQRQRAASKSQEKMATQRLRQEEQIERMRQKLDLQRENRELDFEGRKFTATQAAKDARAKLSREATSQESELDRLSKAAIEGFKETGRMRRKQVDIEAGRPSDAQLEKEFYEKEKAGLDVAAYPISQKDKITKSMDRIQSNLTVRYDELAKADKWFGGNKEQAKRLREEIEIMEAGYRGMVSDLGNLGETLEGNESHLRAKAYAAQAKLNWLGKAVLPNAKQEQKVARYTKVNKYFGFAERAISEYPQYAEGHLRAAFKQANAALGITEDEFRTLWKARNQGR